MERPAPNPNFGGMWTVTKIPIGQGEHGADRKSVLAIFGRPVTPDDLRWHAPDEDDDHIIRGRE